MWRQYRGDDNMPEPIICPALGLSIDDDRGRSNDRLGIFIVPRYGATWLDGGFSTWSLAAC